MPIQAPKQRVGQVAGEFGETTAPYRKTGPVERFPPVSQHVRNLLRDGLGSVAARVEELSRDGKMVTTTTLRAAELAAKIQRGEEAINAAEIAQAQISVREALDVGLMDPDSPYYQANATLRAQRAGELQTLHDELNGYLTGEARRELEDVIITERRWRLPFRASWFPLQRVRYDVALEAQTVPLEDRPLTQAERVASETQSRIVENYDQIRTRITTERYGTRPYAALTPEEKRLVSYATSEELSKRVDEESIRAILDEVRQGVAQDTIDEAIENGTPVEQRLAIRAQKIEENQEEMLRRARDLAGIRSMSEFQRFLGVDDTMLSQTEIAEAIIRELGIFNAREIARLRANPDRTFNRWFQQAGELGTLTFVPKLFRERLERFTEERGVVPRRPERPAGTPVENLNRDGYVGLSPEGLALQLVGGRLGTDPLTSLRSLGIPEAQAQAMLQDVETTRQYVTHNPDGTYTLNEAKLGLWSDADLALLSLQRGLNLNDPATVANLRTQMETALQATIPDQTTRNAALDRKIQNVRDLVGITNNALPQAEQQRILRSWDKRSLALLAIFLGTTFMTKIINLMPVHEQRAFQNLFE